MILIYRMNQQWLTTFMSNVRTRLKTQLEERIKTQLEGRGIRLSTADIGALLEDVSPKASHAALGYAMNLMRPFSAGMGIRIARLSDTQVELVLPVKNRNLNKSGEIHEAALLASATEAAQLLWERHAPMGDFKIYTRRVQLETFKHLTDEIRIRLELPESLRESVLTEIRKTRKGRAEMQAHIYDVNDQAVAEVQLDMEFSHTPSIGKHAGTQT